MAQKNTGFYTVDEFQETAEADANTSVLPIVIPKKDLISPKEIDSKNFDSFYMPHPNGATDAKLVAMRDRVKQILLSTWMHVKPSNADESDMMKNLDLPGDWKGCVPIGNEMPFDWRQIKPEFTERLFVYTVPIGCFFLVKTSNSKIVCEYSVISCRLPFADKWQLETEKSNEILFGAVPASTALFAKNLTRTTNEEILALFGTITLPENTFLYNASTQATWQCTKKPYEHNAAAWFTGKVCQQQVNSFGANIGVYVVQKKIDRILDLVQQHNKPSTGVLFSLPPFYTVWRDVLKHLIFGDYFSFTQKAIHSDDADTVFLSNQLRLGFYNFNGWVSLDRGYLCDGGEVMLLREREKLSLLGIKMATSPYIMNCGEWEKISKTKISYEKILGEVSRVVDEFGSTNLKASAAFARNTLVSRLRGMAEIHALPNYEIGLKALEDFRDNWLPFLKEVNDLEQEMYFDHDSGERRIFRLPDHLANFFFNEILSLLEKTVPPNFKRVLENIKKICADAMEQISFIEKQRKWVKDKEEEIYNNISSAILKVKEEMNDERRIDSEDMDYVSYEYLDLAFSSFRYKTNLRADNENDIKVIGEEAKKFIANYLPFLLKVFHVENELYGSVQDRIGLTSDLYGVIGKEIRDVLKTVKEMEPQPKNYGRFLERLKKYATVFERTISTSDVVRDFSSKIEIEREKLIKEYSARLEKCKRDLSEVFDSEDGAHGHYEARSKALLDIATRLQIQLNSEVVAVMDVRIKKLEDEVDALITENSRLAQKNRQTKKKVKTVTATTTTKSAFSSVIEW